ncbi:MAG: NADPH-dependent FMN reductase [Roseovarius sp.]
MSKLPQGLPPAVQDLQAQLRLADGLLLITPEYNNGIPVVIAPSCLK